MTLPTIATNPTTDRIADIVVGERHRRDLGEPPGETWREMWARPFDYSKLAAPPLHDMPDIPECLRRKAGARHDP